MNTRIHSSSLSNSFVVSEKKLWINHLKTLFVIVSISVLSTSCAITHGDKRVSDPKITSQIKVGISTKQNVRDLIGEPSGVQFSEVHEGEETWIYQYFSSTTRGTSFVPIVGNVIGGSDEKMSSYTVRFDKNGVVKQAAGGTTTGGMGGLQDRKK